MKKVITGWIGRSETINSCIGRYESESSFDIEMSKVKGRKIRMARQRLAPRQGNDNRGDSRMNVFILTRTKDYGARKF